MGHVAYVSNNARYIVLRVLDTFGKSLAYQPKHIFRKHFDFLMKKIAT